MKSNKTILKTLLTSTLLICMLSGCSDSSESTDKQSVDKQQEEPKELKPWDMSFPPEPPYDDKEFWAEPRIQFVWYRRKHKKDYSPDPEIYSMKLDGSDIRLAASSELIRSVTGAGLIHPPVRSPNNRYIALGQGAADDLGLHSTVIDLKTKEKIFMSKGGAIPEFNWTPDSKNVIFYSNDYMKNFNVETRTLTKRPIIHSIGIHLLEDGKTFLATDRANGYRLHNFDGSLIEKVQIPGVGMTHRNYLSADFKHLVFGYGDQLYIFDIINKKMVFKSQNKHQAHDNCSTLIPDTNKLFYRGAWGEHFTVDIFDPTKIEPIDAPSVIPMCTTQVINYPAK